jgi:hypothetical protein
MADEAQELGMLMEEAPVAAPAPTNILITLDTPVADVVRWDAEGKNLIFEDAFGKFLDLPDDAFQKLSGMNQTRYLISFRSNTRLKKEKANPELFRSPDIEVSPRLASATSRIEVYGKNPDKDYVWKRTDELQAANYEGWRVSADSKLQTFGGEVGSSRQIAADGKTEMVLMEAPKGTSKALQLAAAEKSKKRMEGVEASTAADMRQSGGVPYVPRPGDRGNFS